MMENQESRAEHRRREYRRAAVECLDELKTQPNPAMRALLYAMAVEWLRLSAGQPQSRATAAASQPAGPEF
jgi:hypothetical protein